MLDWSKSYELYLGLSEKQRLSIGRKANELLSKEIENLSDEEILRPTLYVMSFGPFLSLSEEHGKEEYNFFRMATGYKDTYEGFLYAARKGQNEKVGQFLQIYFQKIGGEVLTAYLSLALALVTIKGEITDEEKALIERIHG